MNDASEVDLDLQLATDCSDLPLAAEFERWIAAALAGRRARVALTVRIVSREESNALNAAYRGKDSPTNVLSFPFECPPGLPAADPAHDLLGDLVFCAGLVRDEAREQGKTPAAHWAHLTVHGVLHLLGHDHDDDHAAAAMEALETRILTDLGFPAPYADDADDTVPDPVSQIR